MQKRSETLRLALFEEMFANAESNESEKAKYNAAANQKEGLMLEPKLNGR